MTTSDLGQVAALHMAAFNRPVSPFDFGEYVQRVYFDHPDYSDEFGCQVFENASGEIKAALFSLPMRFRISGHSYVGRMLSSFMRAADSSPKSVERMILRFRPRNQDFAFVCTANLRSMNIANEVGSSVLPIHSLKWRRLFRPGSAWSRKLKNNQRSMVLRVAAPSLTLLDPVVRRLDTGLEVPKPRSVSSVEISPEEFRSVSEAFLDRFSISPHWMEDEFGRIISHIKENSKLGDLRIRAVKNGSGHSIGAFAYLWSPDQQASVFEILSKHGRENDVVHELFAHLDRSGCSLATGRAQPYLMPAFSMHNYVDYRHQGHVAVSSRHPEVLEAVRDQSIYLGGFASEDWNRLLTGF